MNRNGKLLINKIIADNSTFSFKEIESSIFYDEGRLGIGRYPLYRYKIDVAVPTNDTVTAFHIGDGKYGFSMGNGTKEGFIPEIIGVGSDENDAGLYFVGIAGNDVSSNIPLIILDSRSSYNTQLLNRPILGVTSGDYNNYFLTINSNGDVDIKGDISVTDIKINGLSLTTMLLELQAQIDDLKTKIT